MTKPVKYKRYRGTSHDASTNTDWPIADIICKDGPWLWHLAVGIVNGVPNSSPVRSFPTLKAARQFCERFTGDFTPFERQ